MIVLDVETTGTDPKVHSILSIGALDFSEPTNQFYDECRVWDGAAIEPKALEINGFSREEVQDQEKKSEAELVRAFVAWATDRVGERTFVAQNVSFDFEFVRAACARAGIDFPFAKRTLDIHSLVWLHMVKAGKTPPTEKHHSALASKDILVYCGLPEEVSPHNAMTGALWHAEVLSRIAYNRPLLKEFEEYPLPGLSK